MSQRGPWYTHLCWLVLLIPLVPLVACRPVPAPPEVRPGEPTHYIYLVSHGRHVGIALHREALAAERWPALATLDAWGTPRYVEVGWGDMRYYTAGAPTWADGARALFWPTDSVLHLVGVHRPLPAAFPQRTILQVEVAATGFERLVDFIVAHHADATAPVPVARSLYGRGYFFAAHCRYHFFYNSNRWAAEALERAGVPIASSIILFEHQLMAQAARTGRPLREP